MIDLSKWDKNCDVYEHLELFYNLCLETKARLVVEFGVRTGESTRAFIEGIKETNGQVTSIDINDCHTVSDYQNWLFIQANTKDINLFKEIDILYIDSSHKYKETLSELRRFSPLVKVGGYILMHDTIGGKILTKRTLKNIILGLFNPKEMYHMTKNFLSEYDAVNRAIDKFLKDNLYSYTYKNRNYCNGLGILKKIK